MNYASVRNSPIFLKFRHDFFLVFCQHFFPIVFLKFKKGYKTIHPNGYTSSYNILWHHQLKYWSAEQTPKCKMGIILPVNYSLHSLTNHREEDGMTQGWSRRYLTFVLPSIPFLDVVNLEEPIIGPLLMNGFESVVACVGESANCQKVEVTGPDPWDLWRRDESY